MAIDINAALPQGSGAPRPPYNGPAQQDTSVPTPPNIQADQSQQMISPVAPAQSQPTAPSVTTPPVSPSPNQRLHSFVSSVLGGITSSLAGKPETKYVVDGNGKLIADPNQPADTRGNQIRRTLGNALEGLGAGSRVPQQKSGLASALAGIGAGAGAQKQEAEVTDQANKKQGDDDYNRQQEKLLRQYQIARINAETYTTWQHAMDSDLDHDPQRAKYKAYADAAEEAGLQVTTMSEKDAKAAQANDKTFAVNHLVFPAGYKPQTGPDGQVLMDPKTGQPLRDGQVLVIQGGHMTDKGDQVVSLPSALVDDIHKYGDSLGIANAKNLKEGDEVDADQFFKLIGAAQSGHKKELEGWVKPQIVVDEDGKKFERNTNTGETREAKAIPTADVKNIADASKKDSSGDVTPALKYREDREDARVKMKKVEDGTSADADRAVVAEAIRKGRMDPSQLSKRSKDYNATLAEADKQEMAETGKHFNIAQAQTDYKFANNPATQNTLKYLNSLTGEDDKSGNLGELVAQSNRINRTSFPPLNDAEAWSKLNLAGDASMAAYYATVTEVADQVAKILQGGGSGSGTSDAKLVQAQALFNQKFTKSQVEAVATTLRTLLGNRKKEMIGNNRYLREQFGSPISSVTGQTQQTGQPPNGGFTVTDPRGTVHSFPDQASADNFKKLAGIN